MCHNIYSIKEDITITSYERIPALENTRKSLRRPRRYHVRRNSPSRAFLSTLNPADRPSDAAPGSALALGSTAEIPDTGSPLVLEAQSHHPLLFLDFPCPPESDVLAVHLPEAVRDEHTLRIAFEQVYTTLPHADQFCLRALAVLSDEGFSIASAAAVWHMDTFSAGIVIRRLADTALVQPVEETATTWRLAGDALPFVAEKLRQKGEDPAVEQRLAVYLLRLWQEHHASTPTTAPQLAREIGNLRCAVRAALRSGDGSLLAWLATLPRNWLFAARQNFAERESWLTAALQLCPGWDILIADVHLCLGDIQRATGRHAEALASYARAQALYQSLDEPVSLANCLRASAESLLTAGDEAGALAHFARALALFRASNDRLGEANTLWARAALYQRAGQPDAAAADHQRALELYHAVNG